MFTGQWPRGHAAAAARCMSTWCRWRGYVTTVILENEKSVTHCIVHRIIFAVPQQKDNPPLPKSLPSLSDFQFKADQNFSKQDVLQKLVIHSLPLIFRGGRSSLSTASKKWYSDRYLFRVRNEKANGMDGWMDGKSIQPPSQMLPALAAAFWNRNQHTMFRTTTGGKVCLDAGEPG